MSYDIYLNGRKCDLCGSANSGPELPNPTYNLTPIFDLALTGEPLPSAEVSEVGVVLFREETSRPRGLRLLAKTTGADSIPMIAAAIQRLNDPEWRPRFLELEPTNRWGDLPGAIRVMEELLRAAEEYPTNEWDVR